MKKVFWINQIIFAVILLLIACKKEPPSGNTEITHWPVLKTLDATNVDSTKAKLNGTVNGYGLSTTVIFEYGTTTSYGNTVTASQSPVTGDSITHVSADISGLDTSSSYYFRIKADNSLWINFFGFEKIFYTIPSVRDIDGNIYYTVRIGSQVWMQENLKTTKYSNGDLIGTTNPPTLDISAEATPKYQWAYNYDESYVATYGRFYTGWAVFDARNVCPTGWHVPTNEEWIVLCEYLGGYEVAGGKLKEAGTSHWQSPNTEATNESGFTALQGSIHHGDGTFSNLGEFVYWWTSTEDKHYEGSAFCPLMFPNSSTIYIDRKTKQWGISVRCIKDN
jgi:uncharacterized protein (TIGR02145 family)